MKSSFIATGILFLFCLSSREQPKLNLMPLPHDIRVSEGNFTLLSGFTVNVEADSGDSILLKAVNRFYQALNRKTSMYFIQQRITGTGQTPNATLKIKVGRKAEPQPGIDESYTLEISSSGILLNAPNTMGALHALETLYQLCTQGEGKFYFPNLTISDAPRFAWRGLMIDVARHFIPLEVLERNLEAMAAVKMNVLHLHLSDHEGFRIESKSLPALHQRGSNGEYYSQAQIRELIEFARERGIMVVPEFDMPGHSQSWFAGYPALSSSKGPFEPGSPMNLKDISNKNVMAIMQLMQTAPIPAMDPSKDSTYILLEKFFAEMSAIFPSPYFHIGADENNGVVWKNNPSIVNFMKKNKIPDTHALQAYFVNRVGSILRKYHKKVMGWEEMFSKGMASDVTLQVWFNGNYLKQVLDNGNPLVVSRGLYLDHFLPAYIHYTNPDLNVSSPGGKGRVMGGESAQWTEAADPFNIEGRIWPRNAAIAERLWSDSAVNNIEDMYRRLFIVSSELDERGLQHIGNYERELRRLAAANEQEALADFLDVLTPLKGYKKLFSRISQPENALYQTAPLTEISDIVFVDNRTRWEFHQAVQSYLAMQDSVSYSRIEDHLQRWQQCSTKLRQAVSRDPRLGRVRNHLDNLQAIATVGLEAIENIRKKIKASPDWIKEKSAILAAADKPYAETEISILGDLMALVKQEPQPLPSSFPLF